MEPVANRSDPEQAVIEAVRLPLDFDPSLLRRDLDGIAAARWIAHFNTGDYAGDWSGVALRGPADATHPIQSLLANPGIEHWANTDLLDICPYFEQVLSQFACPLLSVRLLRLAAGSKIKEHCDDGLGLEDGELRLHVPIVTDSQVEFILNGSRVELGVGEVWYLNVNLPHRVANNSQEHRVHLVADCKVNKWLREMITGNDDTKLSI